MEEARGSVLGVEAFEMPGLPEIGKAADAQRRARLALVSGDHAEARRLSAEGLRYAHLARLRLQSRRDRAPV